ncbi:MAG: hypothetical protein K6A36_07195 [Paludibacteraceae bacterium]|nr:hypothetical protein [Paludibacteraceae bacterium]
MKTKSYLIVLLAIVLNGCDPYLVPDNFPREEFYSYAPYELNDVVRLVNGSDTIEYVVVAMSEDYNRGRKDCDCGEEMVNKHVQFGTETEKIDLWIDCIDRKIFEMNMQSGSSNIDARYEVRISDKASSKDDSRIFREFADEIVLQQNGQEVAKVQKGKGLLWFVDADGRKWTAE